MAAEEGGSQQEDHPRVCGEQNGEISAFMDIEGSPPRVRGTEFCAVMDIINNGITPACAGNSLSAAFQTLL